VNIAVFGSRGFIGRNLTEFLQKCGHQVTAFSSRDGRSIDPVTGLLVPTFNFTKPVDIVFYLAQSPHYRHGDERLQHMRNVNTITATRVAELAKLAGTKRFFYASSGNVYAHSFNPLSESSPLRRDDPYANSKILAEDQLKKIEGIETCCLRFFGVFGRDQQQMLLANIASRIQKGEAIYLEPNPENEADQNGLKLSFIDINSAVSALERLISIKKIPAALNVAGPQALSVRDASICLGEILQKRPVFVMKKEPRRTDLIADISLLKKTVELNFIGFQEALKEAFGR
jgi:UDP-glucose 4-epimerase